MSWLTNSQFEIFLNLRFDFKDFNILIPKLARFHSELKKVHFALIYFVGVTNLVL
jgi:hypothetical protein